VSRRALLTGATMFLACLGVLVGEGRAGADVTATGAVTAKYLRNTSREASAFDARVELDLLAGPVTVGAVYRAYQLTDPAYNPAGIEVPAAEIKHRYVEFTEGRLTARAGNFLATFGHGLTLRSYEDVDLEHDTLLDGLIADYAFGPVSVTGLGGTVTERLSSVRTRDHTIGAARASAPVADWLTIAASAVERAQENHLEGGDVPPEQARFDDSVLGVEAESWTGPLTLAAEYATRTGQNPLTEGSEIEGHAAYAAATLEAGPMTFFGEVKDYLHYSDYTVSPPTCVREHLWTLMNRATYEINLDDEHGFLAEGSALLGDEFYVVGGASEARKHDEELAHWEMFGEVERNLEGGGALRAGASWSREYELGKFTEHRIGALDLDFALPSGDVVEASVEAQSVEEPSGDEYEDYLASLTFYPRGDVTFSTVLETTTSESETKDLWLMIEVKRLFPDDLEAGLSFGTERGGKKCSGGVCYFEPEFEGVRLRLTRFF
jgi:hypothetical protein